MILYGSRASDVLYEFLKKSNIFQVFFLPVNICPVVPFVFFLNNILYEFVDIDKTSLCINEDFILDKIRKNPGKYGGVLFNHTYGTNYNPSLFFKNLKQYDPSFCIIDDRCLCLPELSIENELIDLTLFSTGNSKQISLGYGGYGFTLFDDSSIKKVDAFNGNESLDSNAEYYKNSLLKGIELKDSCHAGFNRNIYLDDWKIYKMSILNNFSSFVQNKELNSQVYLNKICKTIQIDNQFQKWRFNILVDNKEEVIKELFKNGLFASSHYVPLVKKDKLDLYPNAYKLSNRVINLFIDKNYSLEMAEKTAEIVENKYRLYDTF